MYTAIENNNIQVNLLTASNDTGWSVDGNIATHVACNSGDLPLLNYPVISNHVYQITYTVLTISGGEVNVIVGGTSGTSHTTPNIYIDTITAGNTNPVQFNSNANCSIELFYISDVTVVDPITIVYAALNKKWSDFRTIYPDFGWSLFENTITAKDGQLYFHENGTDNTNNFYGVAYQTFIQAVFANNPTVIHTFDVLSYQANMLLTSTQGGITTPTGQQTTLIDTDFIKAAYTDGVTSLTVYQNQNVYSASLLGNELDSTINGEPMQGNYIIVQLQTVDGSSTLKLFTMAIKETRKYIGNR